MGRLSIWTRRGLALLTVTGAVVVLARPWADLRLDATVTGATDASGVVLRDRLSQVFSGRLRRPPRLSTEYDLTPLAGELLRIELTGAVRSRWHGMGKLAEVGWVLELVTEAGAERLDFIGWRGLAGRSQRPCRVGSPSFVSAASQDAFASPMPDSGRLWRVIRVPDHARLRVSALPLLELGTPKMPTARRRALPARIYGRSGARPDIFIYIVDALRSDHMGCYGYQRPTTPTIDAFAEEAVLHEDAQTPASWTNPAIASLLTGVDPLAHGVVSPMQKLPDWPITLAEVLRTTGYSTLAVTTNGNVASELGFGQGFDLFSFCDQAKAPWAVAETSAFLRDARGPVFAYLHIVEPHSPYKPSPESRRLFDRGFEGGCDGSRESLNRYDRGAVRFSHKDREHLLDLYDADVREADAGFAEFLALLKRTNRYDQALVILAADHGESFGEHGTLEHGNSLSVEELHIPLIVKLPRGERGGTRVKAPVTLADLYPTVLQIAGAGARLQYGLSGRDLFGSVDARRRLFAHVRTVDIDDCELAACTDEDGYKRVLVLADPNHSAPPRAIGLWGPADADERTDLSARLPVRAAYDEQLIADWLSRQQAARGSRVVTEVRELPRSLKRSLKDLGYIK